MTNLAIMESGVGGQTAAATCKMFLASSTISSIMYLLLTQQLGMQKTLFQAFAKETESSIEKQAQEYKADAEKAICSAAVTGGLTIAGSGFAIKDFLSSGEDSTNLKNIKDQKSFLEKDPENGQASISTDKEDFDDARLKKLIENPTPEENGFIDKKQSQKLVEQKNGKTVIETKPRGWNKWFRKTKTENYDPKNTDNTFVKKHQDLEAIRSKEDLRQDYKNTLNKREEVLEKRINNKVGAGWGKLSMFQMLNTGTTSAFEAKASLTKEEQEKERAECESSKTLAQASTETMNQSMSMSTKGADSANKIADSATTMVYDIMRNNAV